MESTTLFSKGIFGLLLPNNLRKHECRPLEHAIRNQRHQASRNAPTICGFRQLYVIRVFAWRSKVVKGEMG